MESYIVRIYRRFLRLENDVAGVVEDPIKDTRATFSNMDELNAILGQRVVPAQRSPAADETDARSHDRTSATNEKDSSRVTKS